MGKETIEMTAIRIVKENAQSCNLTTLEKDLREAVTDVTSEDITTGRWNPQAVDIFYQERRIATAWGGTYKVDELNGVPDAYKADVSSIIKALSELYTKK